MTNKAQEDVSYEISDSVLPKVVKMAALEVPGTEAISTTLLDRLGKKSQGISVRENEEGMTIDVHVIAQYGGNLRELAVQIQAAVTKAVRQMVNPEVLTVHVFIEDVIVK